jgi:AcrR family transcriptional regulator
MSDDELQQAETTRQRILEAAEGVFAEKGFNQATVREILKRAGVGNIAAINYHFGDKERLYIEAVKNAHQCCSAIPFPEWPTNTSPQQKLREFIGVLAERMLKPIRVSATKLMMREIADPSQACTEVVRDYIQPMAEVLREILSQMFPTMPNERIYMLGNSIVGQCLFYRQNRPIIEQLMGKTALERITPEVLAEHVSQFTLAALAHVGEKP